VARQAQRRGRELDGLDLGILGVRRRRAVAGFARERGVMAALLKVGDLAVAVQARGLAGEGRPARPVVAARAGALVAVDAEIRGDEDPPEDEEDHRPRGEERGDSNQVASISKKLSHASGHFLTEILPLTTTRQQVQMHHSTTRRHGLLEEAEAEIEPRDNDPR
jgi:hypothetical protein